MGADVRAAATKERLEVPKDFSRSVDEALITMRDGDPKTALEKLRELEAKQPDVSSITYLVALAAMRSGDLNLADEKTEASITKKERVSDALAIQAVLEAMKRASKNYRVMGDAKLRGELLLRQAILADEANPVPYIRLSILLRYQKRNDEALEMLHAGGQPSHGGFDVGVDQTRKGVGFRAAERLTGFGKESRRPDCERVCRDAARGFFPCSGVPQALPWHDPLRSFPVGIERSRFRAV